MQRLSICIAEDSKVVRAAIQSLLNNSGYFDIVGAAQDGREAVEFCRQSKPQVVLLDVAMPTMDGIEAARQITVICPESVIIMLSSQDDMEVIRDALKAGARDFIRKPVHGPELIQKILTIYAREGSRRAAGSEASRRKILVFTAARSGSGTTTLAINTGVSFAKKLRKRVLIVDLDFMYADASHGLGRKQQPSIVELVAQPDPQKAENIRKFIVETAAGVHLLAAPLAPSMASLRDPSVEAVLRQIEPDYDCVIVDLPPTHDETWFRFMDASDLVFLVVGSDVPGIRAAKVCLELIKRSKLPMRRVKVIYNHLTTDAAVDKKDVQDFINVLVYSEISCDRELVTKAYLGRSPFMLKEMTQISRDIEALVEKIFMGKDTA